MKYRSNLEKCVKCDRYLKPDEEVNYGMCSSCYYKYLLEFIDYTFKKREQTKKRSIMEKFFIFLKRKYRHFKRNMLK